PLSLGRRPIRRCQALCRGRANSRKWLNCAVPTVRFRGGVAIRSPHVGEFSQLSARRCGLLGIHRAWARLDNDAAVEPVGVTRTMMMMMMEGKSNKQKRVLVLDAMSDWLISICYNPSAFSLC